MNDIDLCNLEKASIEYQEHSRTVGLKAGLYTYDL